MDFRKERMKKAREFSEKKNIPVAQVLQNKQFQQEWKEFKNQYAPGKQSIPVEDKDFPGLHVSNVTVKYEKNGGVKIPGLCPRCGNYTSPKKGGAYLPATDIKKFVEESGKDKGWDMRAFGYMNDSRLSSPTEQVYRRVGKKGQPTIVVHYIRGTADFPDVWTDVKFSVDYKDERFQRAKRNQKKVDKKYGPWDKDNILFIVGSSLGAAITQYIGKDYDNNKYVTIITIGKPVNPVQLMRNEQPSSNQTDVRTTLDPISFLKPLQPHKNDKIVESEHSLLKPHLNHMGADVMDTQALRDKMIGNARRMPVKDLKKVAILLRKGRSKKMKKEGGKININGLKKSEIQSSVSDLIQHHENVGDKVWKEALDYIEKVHKACDEKKASKKPRKPETKPRKPKQKRANAKMENLTF